MIDPKQHILHRGLTSIRGPLIFMRNAEGVGLYDRVEVLPTEHESPRLGRVVSISGSTAVIDVFQGTEGLSLTGSRACGFWPFLSDWPSPSRRSCFAN